MISSISLRSFAFFLFLFISHFSSSLPQHSSWALQYEPSTSSPSPVVSPSSTPLPSQSSSLASENDSDSSSSPSPIVRLPGQVRHAVLTESIHPETQETIFSFHPKAKYSYETGAMTGCASVDFVVPFSIGSPAQPSSGSFSLVIDTGSTSLAVATTICGSTCSPVTTLYNPPSNGNQGGASIQTVFGDMTSWTGSVWRDVVTVGASTTPFPMDFVAITSQSTNPKFFTTNDCNSNNSPNYKEGIAGMAFPSLAAGGDQRAISFFDYMVQSNVLISNQFALQMCLHNGNLWLGGYDPAYIASGSAMQYVPLAASAWYNVFWTDVSLSAGGSSSAYTSVVSGSQNLGPSCGNNVRSGGCTIVDSGTSLFLVSQNTFNSIVSTLLTNTYFKNNFGASFFGGSGQCVSLPIGDTVATANSQLPYLRLGLSATASANAQTDVFLHVAPISSYIYAYTKGSTSAYCPGMAVNSQFSVFGWTIMNQFIIHFDRTTSPPRVGFAPVDPNHCVLNNPSNDTPLTYSWSTPSYSSSCSSSCIGGVQVSSPPVVCKNNGGTTVSDFNCYGQVKPPTYIPCNTNVACSAVSPLPTATISSQSTSISQGSSLTVSFSTSVPTTISLFLTSEDPTVHFSLPLATDITSNTNTNSISYPTTIIGGVIPTGTYMLSASVFTYSNIYNSTSGPITITASGSAAPLCACGPNGFCDSGSTTCSCIGGYTGATCNTAPTTPSACQLVCSNGGTLLASTCTCGCPSPWAGLFCERYTTSYHLTYAVPYTSATNADEAFLTTALTMDVVNTIGTDSMVTVSFQSDSNGDLEAMVTLSSAVTSTQLSAFGTVMISAYQQVATGSPSPVSSSPSSAHILAAGDGGGSSGGSSGLSTTYKIIIAVVVVVVGVLILCCIIKACCMSDKGNSQSSQPRQPQGHQPNSAAPSHQQVALNHPPHQQARRSSAELARIEQQQLEQAIRASEADQRKHHGAEQTQLVQMHPQQHQQQPHPQSYQPASYGNGGQPATSYSYQ